MRVAIVALAVALVACAATGRQVRTEQLAGFRKGVTTMNDVVRELGPPTTHMAKSDGSHTLMYTYAQAQVRPETFIPLIGAFVGGMDTRSSTVALTFGSDGTLTEYTSMESVLGTGQNLAAGASVERTNQPSQAATASGTACTSDHECADGGICSAGECRPGRL